MMAKGASSREQSPVPLAIGPVPTWAAVFGAAAGLITLFFLGLVILAPDRRAIICDSFPLLAAGVAFGAALSASFMGGAAAAQGSLGSSAQHYSLTYSVGGGVAVLVIVFFAFYSLQPNATKCQQRTDHEIEFQVPSTLRIDIDSNHFRKSVTDLDSRKRKMTVLVLEGVSEMQVDIKRDGASICSLMVHIANTRDGLDRFRAGNTLKNVPIALLSKPIKLDFTDSTIPASDPGNIKARSSACLRFSFESRPIYFLGMVPREGEVYYSLAPDSPIPNLREGISIPGPSGSVNPSFFPGLVSKASAQTGSPLQYSELRLVLSDSDAGIRNAGRDYLASNFERYRQDVLMDLRGAVGSDLYLETVLSALTLAIELADNGAWLPDKRKGLDFRLSYLNGSEEQIVELTAHDAAGIRDKARQLVERFPVDAFDESFSRRLLRAAAGDCTLGRDTQYGSRIIYAAIFFAYGRIVEKRSTLNPSAKDAADIDARAALVREVARRCLEPSLRIDSAAVDYARATVYAAWRNYGSRAREVAGEFLRTIQEGTERQYYFQPHIARMKEIAGALNLKNGSYTAERGYYSPNKNCESRYVVDSVVVKDGIISFQSEGFSWVGTVDQATGIINIPPEGISRGGHPPRYPIQIQGPANALQGSVNGAQIYNGYCGPGYFRLLAPIQ